MNTGVPLENPHSIVAVDNVVNRVRAQEDIKQIHQGFTLKDIINTQLGLAFLVGTLSMLTLYVTKPMFVQTDAVREHLIGTVSGWRILVISIVMFLTVLLLPRFLYQERRKNSASKTDVK